MIGCFQRETFYRLAQRRWAELARTASLVVAVADFGRLREPEGAPVEVPITTDQAMAREWTVIVDAPSSPACLATWEHLSQRDPTDGDRRFEVLWSVEPAVVRSATQVATRLLERSAPAVAKRIPPALAPSPSSLPPELRYVSSLTHRMVGYLGTILQTPPRAG